jgi:hypothetical protein
MNKPNRHPTGERENAALVPYAGPVPVDAYSAAKWTAIPAQAGQRFRCNLDTDSGLKLDSFFGSTGILSQRS